MRRRATRWLVLALGAAATLAGCSGGGDGALDQALSATPAGADQVLFTDWNAVETSLGFDGLTTQSSPEERERFLQQLSESGMFASSPLADHLTVMPEEYGWSLLDADWEVAAYGPDLAPSYVVRLGDDLDLDVVTSSLADHGFRPEKHGESRIWTIDAAGAGLVAPFFAAALVEDQRLFIMGSVDGIEAALDATAGESLADDPEATAIAGSLGVVSTAAILTGSAACPTLTEILGPRGTPEVIAQLRADTPKLGSLKPYEALGMGFPTEGDAPARVVLRYADEAAAEADAEVRRSILQTGTSVVAGQPYRDYIRVLSAEADGRDVVLELALPQDRSVLPQMLLQRDLLWAACPGE